MQFVLDGVILIVGTDVNEEEPDFDVRVTIGNTVYMIDSSSGHFSRERNGETVYSKLESNSEYDLLRPVLHLCQIYVSA